MRRALTLACALLGMTMACAEPVAPAPNARLSFEFPDLPDTLAAMSQRKKAPAKMTALLPANYTAEGRFPLFVYLLGGEGGDGGWPDRGRAVVGDKDFICVGLPLFKDHMDRDEPAGGLMVSMDDIGVISRCYRTMLGRLFEAVPNITAERSVLGGFSNGAHTTAVLLAGQDPFILEHFRAFFLLEGGAGPMLANVLQKSSLRPCRFLLMVGDRARPDTKPPSTWELMFAIADAGLKGRKIDSTLLAMRGYGHEEPAPFLAVIGQWARGEALSEVPPKPQPAEAPK